MFQNWPHWAAMSLNSLNYCQSWFNCELPTEFSLKIKHLVLISPPIVCILFYFLFDFFAETPCISNFITDFHLDSFIFHQIISLCCSLSSFTFSKSSFVILLLLFLVHFLVGFSLQTLICNSPPMWDVLHTAINALFVSLEHLRSKFCVHFFN